MKTPIKISIITVCFNAADTIERTISSVCSQRYAHIEYIVVDGGSTDGTLGIVDKYAAHISKIVSEKDKGIYDAMNKGTALSTGDVVYFLNADDRFCDDGVLADVASAFEANYSKTLIYGKVIPEEVPAHILPFLKEEYQIRSINDFIYITLCHQAVFARRALFSRIGGFDCRYKFAADYDWLIKAFKYQPSGFYYLNRSIANYHYLGRSFQGDSVTRREKTRIQLKNLFSFEFVFYYARYVLIRGLKKKLLNETF